MKRAHRNTKLSKFSTLANKIKALGFDSVVIVANEKNGTGGQTYLSVGNVDDNQEREFEKDITQLLARVGTTPGEISRSLEALKYLGEMGSLSMLLDKIKKSMNEISDEEEEEEEEDPFDKLSEEDQKKVIELRKEKNKLVKQRKYEEASKVRDMERTILGMNKPEETTPEETTPEETTDGLTASSPSWMRSLHEHINLVCEQL